MESQKLVRDTETVFDEQFHSLVTSVRSDRHDLNNHLTVISGLIKIGSMEAVESYVEGLVGDIQVNNQALTVTNPILASMLYSKMSLWNNADIQFDIKIKTEELIYKMTLTDFIRLISNMLDNAFDATMELDKEQRRIHLSMREEENHYLLIVKNTSLLEKFDLAHFQLGSTTKASTIDRGYGLAIIQDLVKKYKANLLVDVQNQFVVFEIRFPK